VLACVSLAVGRNISLEGDVEGLVQPVPLSGDDCVTHILYPHLLFEFLAVNHRRQFLQYMASTQRELADFWEGLLRSPYGVRLRAHPHIRGLNIEDLSLCIPLTVHGDAAPYGKRRSTLLVQWGPFLGTVGLHVHEHGSGSVRWLRVHNQHENKSGRGGGEGRGAGLRVRIAGARCILDPSRRYMCSPGRGPERCCRLFAFSYAKHLGSTLQSKSAWQHLFWSLSALAEGTGKHLSAQRAKPLIYACCSSTIDGRCLHTYVCLGVHPHKGLDGCPLHPDHPLYKFRGMPLASAAAHRIYRAVLIFGKGDAEFWANECGLPHWNNPEPCGSFSCGFTLSGPGFGRMLVGKGWLRGVCPQCENHSFKADAAATKQTEHSRTSGTPPLGGKPSTTKQHSRPDLPLTSIHLSSALFAAACICGGWTGYMLWITMGYRHMRSATF
jgi:hypothetical protein